MPKKTITKKKIEKEKPAAAPKALASVNPREITTEMKESYLDYAMSVIVRRALPDVRDGLKPVHRRILFAMWNLGLKSSAKFRKSATVVGEVLGKYHPHGDTAVYDSMVRMAQDFSLRYPLVHGQGNFGCFTKDTKVKLTDGRNLTFGELIKENKLGKKNFTYTVNSLGLIAVAEIKKPRLTKKNTPIIRVILDNGEKIKCTPNHKFMMKDGSYKEAENLKPQDSLMPCYEKVSKNTDRLNRKGYTLIFQNKKNEWIPAHHLADNYNLTNKKYNKSAGRVRHHLNFDKLNNNPNNIARMHWKEHWQTHYKNASALHQDENYRKKIATGRKKFWANPANRARYSKALSKRNTKNWEDPVYREKMTIFLSEINKQYIQDHPERRQELSEQATKTLKRLWQNPDYRAIMHEKIIKGNKNHTTNKTGKVKFIKICKKVIGKYSVINENNYLATRNRIYPYGKAPLWETGLSKYFQNDSNLILQEINKNHKVIRIEKIIKKEDVYDLTIDKTHNFCLAAGIFVHNSLDGDSAAAMRYCITGDSLILTDKGILPIKNISSKKEDKIKLNILNHQGKQKPAVKFFNSGKHNIFHLSTNLNYQIKGSSNHPLLTWQPNEFGIPTTKWKLLEEITTQDHVLINRNSSLFSKNNPNLSQYHPRNLNKKHKTNIQLPKTMNKDIAFLLGALTAEGSLHQNQILFSNQDQVFYKKVRDIILKQFKGTKLYEHDTVNGNCKELSLYHQKAVKFLHNIGLSTGKSHTKEIPFSVLLSQKGTVKYFLQGLFEGDGSVSFQKDKRHGGNSTEVTYNSKSEILIKQLKTVLLNFGVITSTPYKDKRNDCYKLLVHGQNNINNFYTQINFFSKRKKQELAHVKDLNKNRMSKTDFIPYLSNYLKNNYSNSFFKKHNLDRYNNLQKNYDRISKILNKSDLKMIDWLLQNHYLFDKVKTITKSKTKEEVYSIKVDSNCHSFIANGFINHNTEAKLKPLTDEMLLDLEKNTVDFASNYDDTQKEPKVLPANLPNLLVNGTLGIAVGMATNIPPHNLSEIIDGVCLLIDKPNSDTDDLFQFIQGPDFPTGAIIYNKNDIKQAYATGKGSIVMRAENEIVEAKGGAFQIIISSVPYQVNKATLLEKIADLVKTKKVEGIRDLRDESSKGDVRIVIDLKKDAYPKKILNQLYKHTSLQTSFHVNMLALVDGIQPRVLTLKMILEEFIKHRQEVVERRTKFELDKAKARAHVLEGLMLALNKIDAVIKTIKASKDREEAKNNLIKKFKLTEIQSIAILEMKLQQLANLEKLKIETELKEKKKIIKELTELLKSPKKILALIKKELLAVKEKFGDERKTRIIKGAVNQFSQEDLIPDENVIIVITKDGYIKRMPLDTFKAQGRGGKGVTGLATKEEDTVEEFFTTSTHNNLLFFTTRGRVFQLKAYEIPVASRIAKGQSIVNFLELAPNEKVSSVFSLGLLDKYKYLVMVTTSGTIKKVEISAFSNVRRSGLIALKLKGEDTLAWVEPSTGQDEIMLTTTLGQAIRFKEKDLRAMGRGAAGVRGIRLKKDSQVSGMDMINKEKIKGYLFALSSNGFGKITAIKNYKTQGRGGSGIKTLKVTNKTGPLASSFIVDPKNLPEETKGDLIIISEKGQVIRLPLKSVPTLGRDTQGVRLMRLKNANDSVANVTLV